MDPAPRGRAYRVKVTVIEEPAQPEAFRVSVTLRGAWGFRVYRGGFVIGPAGLIVRPRVAGETDRNEPASAKDRRQHVRVTRMAQGTWRHRQEDHVATRGYRVGGCYVLPSLDAPSGHVGLRLNLSPSPESIRVGGTVTHAQRGVGFGVRFIDVTTTQSRALLRSVEQLRSDLRDGQPPPAPVVARGR